MSEENNPEDEELDESEDGTEEDTAEETEEESGSGAFAGLAGAAAAGALARKGGKKTSKPTAKGKKGKPVAKGKPAAAKPAPAKDGTVDLNAKVAEIQKLTDKNTVWTVAGYSFTPAKLAIIGTLISSALGGLYGAFEVYKDYQDMKVKIAKYVAPDLSEFDKRLSIIEQNQSETSKTLQDSANKTADYTRDIKNDLKNDIRRLENVVENVERSTKQSQRETDQDIRQLRKEIDNKIQKAMDNPLSGK